MQVCSGIFVDEVWSTCAAHQIHSLSYSLRTVRPHRKVIVVRMVNGDDTWCNCIMRHFDFNGFIHLSCLVLSDGVTLDPCARARCVPCVVNHGNSPGEKQSQAQMCILHCLKNSVAYNPFEYVYKR